MFNGGTWFHVSRCIHQFQSDKRKRMNAWISKHDGYLQHFVWHCVCFLAVMYFFVLTAFFKKWVAWLFTYLYVCHRWKVLCVIYAAEFQGLGLTQTWYLVTEILSLELCNRFIHESWSLYRVYLENIWRIHHLDVKYFGICVV